MNPTGPYCPLPRQDDEDGPVVDFGPFEDDEDGQVVDFGPFDED